MKIRTIKTLFLIIIFSFSATLIAQEFEINNYIYELQSDLTVTVKGHNDKTITEITIPDSVEYEGIYYPITTIGKSAFNSFKRLKDVVLTDNITVFEGFSFANCDSLVNINIPANLVILKTNSFNCCFRLKNIVLPETLEVMEGIVFQQCNNLTEFTFPSKLKKIDNKTLLSCGGIKTINISKGTTDINSSFTLHCTSLENIFVDEENPNYKDLNGALFDKSGDTLLILPPGSKKYIIDPNTKYIQEFAFSNNPLVISLEIPASVTNIHLNAFDNYNSLRNILVDKDNQHYAEIDGVLFSKDLKTLKRYPRGKSCEYVVPETTVILDSCAFYESVGLKKIEIPESVTTIKYKALSGCFTIYEITLPESITEIEDWAIYYNQRLETVVLPSSLKTIPTGCFMNCFALKNIKLPEGLETISEKAFSTCSQLESVVIPEGTISIKESAFSYCRALKTIYLPTTLDSLMSGSFTNLNSLSEVYLNKETDIEKGYSIFNVPLIANATLYVPIGTKTMYESIHPWSDFGNIVEHESLMTSVSSAINENKIFINIKGEIMSIHNSPENEIILVINSKGSIINSVKGNGETIEINVEEKGLLLVKAGNEVVKVIN